MKNISEYIQSGIIELYVFGLATDEEVSEVEEMSSLHEQIRVAIDTVNNNLEQFAHDNAVLPPAVIKPMLMATIDYIKRMENGEEPSFPPLLHEGSQIGDYYKWIKKPSMAIPPFFADVYARIIGHTAQVTTAIVWIKNLAPAEVHDNEYEKFLIVEGTCNIIIEEQVYTLSPGDYFSIPLFKEHKVLVTSNMPCKVILQRVAA